MVKFIPQACLGGSDLEVAESLLDDILRRGH